MNTINSKIKFNKTRSLTPVDEELMKRKLEMKNEKARAKYHQKIKDGGEELRRKLSDNVILNRRNREVRAGIIKKPIGRPLKVFD